MNDNWVYLQSVMYTHAKTKYFFRLKLMQQRAIVRELLGVWTKNFHIRKDQAFSYLMTCFSCQVYPRSQGLSAARVLLIFNEWPSENGSGDENVRSGEKISKYESDKKC
jgi:hypothetical protein